MAQELTFKLEKFEGPLDLLLHLIERDKIDIFDIPIVQITAEYMDYITKMEEEDLDLVSDFLRQSFTSISRRRFRGRSRSMYRRSISMHC